MNRRDALKRLVGTTIAVAVALPFVPDADGHITDDANELDRRAWWRENFTIQKVEYGKNSFKVEIGGRLSFREWLEEQKASKSA